MSPARRSLGRRSTRPALQKLGERGLRSTKARVLILSYLQDRRDHQTAEAILRGLRQRGHTIGPATLYQNLSKLADAALVARINGPDGLMHFDATVAPHPHLACVRCGRFVDACVDESLLQRLDPRDPMTGAPLSDWKLEGIHVELKGTCPACLTT